MRRKKSSGNGRRISPVLVACIGLVLALALLLPTFGAAQQKAGAAKTLKIGYLLCLSGWYSVFDAVEEGHLKIVAQIINERGGLTIQGQKYNIELVGEDGKSTTDGIAAGATKLVYDDNVKFVVGPTAVFGPASSPVFEQNKVLHISGYCSNMPGEIDASTPYGFLGFDASLGTSIASWKALKKEYPNVKTAAVVMPDAGSVPYLVPKVKKLMPAYGLAMVGDVVRYPNEMEDYSPISAKVNAIKGADAVFLLNGTPVAVGGIAKGLRALGNTKPLVHQGLVSGADVMKVSGKDAANDIITMGLWPLAKGNPPLLDEIYNRSGRKMPIFLFNANGLWVLAKVIQAANSLDPAVVKAKWETMDKVDCVYGTTCTFGGDETYGLKHHAIGHPLSYQTLLKGQPTFGGWVNIGRIP